MPLAVIGAANALAELRHPTPIRGRDTESETDVEQVEDEPDGEDGEAARTRAGRGAARALTAAVLVAAVSMSILCLRTGIAMRQNTEQVVDRMLAVATAAAAPNDGGPPIVVTDPRGLGRVSWDHLDQVRILRMPEPGRLEGLLDRLAAAEVGAVVLAVHPDEDLGDQVLGEWRIARDHLRPGQAWRHVELVQRDSLRE